MRRGSASSRLLWLASLAALALLGAVATAQASVGNFAMAVQPDGKIVVAGGSGHVGAAGAEEFGAVARYLPDGRLDPSFGGEGIVLVREQSPFTAVAIQSNGRIVLTAPPNGSGGVVRLFPDGYLDFNFGEKGILYAGASTAWHPTSVAVNGKGAIFVGGMTGYLSEPAEHWYGSIYRITSNGRSGAWIGSMTNREGAPGEPKTFVNDFVLKGDTVVGAGSLAAREPGARSQAVLARLVPGTITAGQASGPDPSFGAGAGLVTSAFFPASPFSEAANALAPDKGKLLLAGTANGDLLVARYSAGGLLDGGFGRHGFNLARFGRATADTANDVAASKAGIFAAGSSSHGCAGGRCTSLLLARFSRDGHLSHEFGKGGLVSPAVDTRAYGNPASEIAYAVKPLAHGKVLVGGLVAGPSSSRFFLRRFDSRGRPDPSFGDHGRLTTLPEAAERAR
jgi:uncharacterized delta-60 repeat protein